jgi:hypothetical protein
MNIETLESALRDAAAGLPPDPQDAYEAVIRRARQRRERRRIAIATAAVGAALALTVAFVVLVGSTDRHVVVTGSSSSSLSSVPPSSRWMPPTQRDSAGHLVVTFRLLSGGNLHLVLPPSVDASAITGFSVGGSVSLTGQPDLARDLLVERGTIANIYRGHQLLKTYPGLDGQSVMLYDRHEDNGMNYLVFQIDGFVVSVWDYPVGDPRGAAMTDQQRELWATHLRGYETADGFLTLDPIAPLTPDRITDGPDASLRLGTNSIDVLFRPCQPNELSGTHDARGFISHTFPDSGTWVCDPEVPLVVHVFGTTKWQQNISANFALQDLVGPLPHQP